VLLGESILPAAGSTSEHLLPALASLMAETGMEGPLLGGIGVAAGPGSYTGLRIGVSTALGLSAGWSVRVKGVSTLRALAFEIRSGAPVLVALRARRGEVFAAVFGSSDPLSEVLVEEGVYEAASLMEAACDIGVSRATGSGLSELSDDSFSRSDGHRGGPAPSTISILAARLEEAFGFDRSPVPVYLRGFREKASPVVH